jgi:hypothetical protein
MVANRARVVAASHSPPNFVLIAIVVNDIVQHGGSSDSRWIESRSTGNTDVSLDLQPYSTSTI